MIRVIKGGAGIKIICPDAVPDNTEKTKRSFDRNAIKTVKIWIDERRENSRTEGITSRLQLSEWSPDKVEQEKLI